MRNLFEEGLLELLINVFFLFCFLNGAIMIHNNILLLAYITHSLLFALIKIRHYFCYLWLICALLILWKSLQITEYNIVGVNYKWNWFHNRWIDTSDSWVWYTSTATYVHCDWNRHLLIWIVFLWTPTRCTRTIELNRLHF